MAQVIPLDSSPNQSFRIVLSIDSVNKALQFKIRYNEIAEYWTMTVIEPTDNTILLDSIPLLMGDYPADNLLEQHAYLNIGAAYLVNVGNVSDNPSDSDLGTNFILIWGDTPDG